MRVGLFVSRVWTGGFFLTSSLWKLDQPGLTIGESIARFRDHEVVPMIEDAIMHPPELLGRPLTLYADFLQAVMLSATGALAPLILFFEVLLGLCLVLGLGVRLTGTLGFLMMFAFNLAKPQPGDAIGDPVGVFLFTGQTSNWPVTLLLLLLVLAAAGRTWGLDAWVRARAPPWSRWVG